jgi:hypothetical protein
MTLQERDRALESLDLDAEAVSDFVSGLDMGRLYLLAEALQIELTERHEGKPLDRLLWH